MLCTYLIVAIFLCVVHGLQTLEMAAQVLVQCLHCTSQLTVAPSWPVVRCGVCGADFPNSSGSPTQGNAPPTTADLDPDFLVPTVELARLQQAAMAAEQAFSAQQKAARRQAREREEADARQARQLMQAEQEAKTDQLLLDEALARSLQEAHATPLVSCSLQRRAASIRGPALMRQESLAVAEELAASVDEVIARLRTINTCCSTAGLPFADPDFQYVPGIDPNVHGWAAPKQVAPVQWKLFDCPSSSDIQQGELGDCWFLSAAGVLASYRQGFLLRTIFPGQEVANPHGAYIVRLCFGGAWHAILVDHTLPVMQSNVSSTHLLYCRGARFQLWPCLVEKAFAKLCGR